MLFKVLPSHLASLVYWTMLQKSFDTFVISKRSGEEIEFKQLVGAKHNKIELVTVVLSDTVYDNNLQGAFKALRRQDERDIEQEKQQLRFNTIDGESTEAGRLWPPPQTSARSYYTPSQKIISRLQSQNRFSNCLVTFVFYFKLIIATSSYLRLWFDPWKCSTYEQSVDMLIQSRWKWIHYWTWKCVFLQYNTTLLYLAVQQRMVASDLRNS